MMKTLVFILIIALESAAWVSLSDSTFNYLIQNHKNTIGWCYYYSVLIDQQQVLWKNIMERFSRKYSEGSIVHYIVVAEDGINYSDTLDNILYKKMAYSDSSRPLLQKLYEIVYKDSIDRDKARSNDNIKKINDEMKIIKNKPLSQLTIADQERLEFLKYCDSICKPRASDYYYSTGFKTELLKKYKHYLDTTGAQNGN